MKHPACPECGHRLSLLRGLTAWNPWKYRCPYCRTVLETSGPWKLATLAAIPLGLVIVATAVIREESGVWHTTDSLLFFLLVFGALFVGWAFSWRYVRFRPRGEPANKGRSAGAGRSEPAVQSVDRGASSPVASSWWGSFFVQASPLHHRGGKMKRCLTIPGGIVFVAVIVPAIGSLFLNRGAQRGDRRQITSFRVSSAVPGMPPEKGTATVT